MNWQESHVIPEMGVTDWPSEAHAPLARVVGFAPLSLAVGYVGDHDELQVLRFAQNDNQSVIVSMRRR
jgi:hypothetical protein